tara:strand:- start:138 stop:635 length:498 start_codon:yes stop_codon:yes gene_type:complete
MKDDMKRVVSHLQEVDSNLVLDSIKSQGCYKIESSGSSLEIESEDIIVEEVGLHGFSVSVNQETVVGVCTDIDEDLYNEGLIRDLIRHIQNLRKDSNLSVDDRVDVFIKHNDKSLSKAIENHEEYLLNEVLGVNIQDDLNCVDYSNDIKINNNEIIIGIKVNNEY